MSRGKGKHGVTSKAVRSRPNKTAKRLAIKREKITARTAK
jgi:hypothetical protein